MIAADADRRTSAATSVNIARAGALGVVVLAVLVGVASYGAAQSAPGLTYLADSNASAAFGLGAGWALVAVGLETLRRGRRRSFGALLVIAGIAWLLPDWSDPAIGSAIEFTLGLGLGWLYPAVVAHAVVVGVANPSTAGERIERAVVAFGYVLFIGLGVLPALAFDPAATGCGSCPTNLLHVLGPAASVETAVTLIGALAAGWTVLASIALAELAIGRPTGRRRRAGIVAPTVAFLVLVGVEVGRDTLQAVPPTDAVDHLVRIGQAVALLGIAAAVALDWLRVRRARARAAALVADLAVSPPVGGLRDHLASVLGDPDLRLVYPTGSGTLVDASGHERELNLRPGRTTTPLLRGGAVVAMIEHDAEVLRDTSEIDEVVAAARLGLAHERLQAELTAQLDALRQARRRIVEARDAERKRLERDLHDGAQQHLIALSIGLQLLERDPRTTDLIQRAAADVNRALDELRDVAHGIYPAILDDEGLAAAVEALAEGSSVPVRIRELAEERCSASTEFAAYELLVAAVRSSTGPVEIASKATGSDLVVQVKVAALPADLLEEVGDRVGAIDGRMSVTKTAEKTTVALEIPCAS